MENGDTYEGEFVMDKAEGNGVLRKSDGCEYAGGWRNDLRSGEGVFKDKDGNACKGKFVDGKRHDVCELYWKGLGTLKLRFENGQVTGVLDFAFEPSCAWNDQNF